MSAEVFTFASQERVDKAWRDYAELAARLRDDTALLVDRTFNEQLAKRHERWRRLFLAMEGA